MKPRVNSTCHRLPDKPELTLYASRATIDTGLENLGGSTIFAAPNNIFTISQQGVQQGITINEAAGFRLTKPLPEADNIRSTLSGGLDFKRYSQNNYNTNSFITSEVTFDQNWQSPSADNHPRAFPDHNAFKPGLSALATGV